LDNHTKLLFIVEIQIMIMKLNSLKRFLGCALAAGVLAFAGGKVQAGAVIGGQLYTPVSLKLVVTYYAGNGKFKKLTVSAKDILVLLGYAKNNQLARGPGGDIFVIDKNTVMADLTVGGFLSMDFNQLLYTEVHPNDGAAFTFTESGLLAVNFYSDGGADESGGHSSAYWFEVSGVYTGSGQVSAIKNNENNEQTVKENLKSPALSGDGFDLDAFNANFANSPSVPVTGDVSGSGSGMVLAVE
jgi:hypothetical protein